MVVNIASYFTSDDVQAILLREMRTNERMFGIFVDSVKRSHTNGYCEGSEINVEPNYTECNKIILNTLKMMYDGRENDRLSSEIQYAMVKFFIEDPECYKNNHWYTWKRFINVNIFNMRSKHDALLFLMSEFKSLFVDWFLVDQSMGNRLFNNKKTHKEVLEILVNKCPKLDFIDSLRNVSYDYIIELIGLYNGKKLTVQTIRRIVYATESKRRDDVKEYIAENINPSWYKKYEIREVLRELPMALKYHKLSEFEISSYHCNKWELFDNEYIGTIEDYQMELMYIKSRE